MGSPTGTINIKRHSPPLPVPSSPWGGEGVVLLRDGDRREGDGGLLPGDHTPPMLGRLGELDGDCEGDPGACVDPRPFALLLRRSGRGGGGGGGHVTIGAKHY